MGLIHLIVATVRKCRETVRSCSLCATPLIAEKMYEIKHCVEEHGKPP